MTEKYRDIIEGVPKELDKRFKKSETIITVLDEMGGDGTPVCKLLAHEINVYKGSEIDPKRAVAKTSSNEEGVWNIRLPKGEKKGKEIKLNWIRSGVRSK